MHDWFNSSTGYSARPLAPQAKQAMRAGIEEVANMTSGKVETVECQHEEKKVYIIDAGPNLNFLICEACYTKLHKDIVQDMLQQVATSAVKQGLGNINIGSSPRKPGW